MFTEKDGLGSPYGNFGITALEAAAMGKPVITNCKDLEVYNKHYGDAFFISANSENEFLQVVNELTKKSIAKIISHSTRNLVVKNHSYIATGNYFKNHII